MGGGGGGTTTVQKADPWEKQMPYLAGGTNQFGTTVPGVFPEAAKLYNNGSLAPDYYSGSTVAGQSKWTQQANQMQANRALNGSASIDNAQASVDSIVAGDAMNSPGLEALNKLAGTDINAGNAGLSALEQMTNAVNPYSKTLLNDAIGQAGAQIDGNFSAAGRYGSGAHENARADAIADLTSQFYANAYDQQMQAANAASQAYLGGIDTQAGAAGQAGTLYNQGTDLRLSGASQAQDLANQAYTDAAALSEAGANLDAFNQAKTDAAVDRWNYDQQKVLTALSNYNQLIQGTYGGTSTGTGKSDYKPSALGTAIGVGATGLGLLDSAIDGDWASLFSS